MQDMGEEHFLEKMLVKIDRSAAYMLRHIAKNFSSKWLCKKKCEIQISYAIGMEEPLSICVNTFGTGTKSEEEIEKN